MPRRRWRPAKVPWTPPLTTQTTQSKSGLANVPCPFPTEGGKVPLYLVSHGRVQKRDWIFRNREWCELCREPVAVWVNHMGRKDHALMDQHYGAMVEWPRRWNPEEVLTTFADELRAELGAFHAGFGRYEREHRTELYALLVELQREGMLSFGDARQTYLSRMQGGLRGMDHMGALVLYEALMGPFMRLYPDGHIQDYSNLVDFCTCSYNMETVYDLCALHTLDEVAMKADYRPSSPAALGLGGIAATSSASVGFESAAEVTDGGAMSSEERLSRLQRSKKQEDLDEEAFSRKAQFVRQVLGQLRWLQLPGQQHPAGFTFPEHVVALGEVCLKYLVVEIIAARLCEYMVRAEPVWRSCGFERKALDVNAIAKRRDDVLPRPITYTYRPMSSKRDDFFVTGSAMSLDKKVASGLQKKSLPVPEAYLHK